MESLPPSLPPSKKNAHEPFTQLGKPKTCYNVHILLLYLHNVY
jgi:hypothetical protein